jgi:hypothetical protein
MSFPPGGVVNLEDNISSNKGKDGFDIEEIIQWDRDLCQMKTFSMALLILSGCAYNSLDQKKYSSNSLTSLQRNTSGGGPSR